MSEAPIERERRLIVKGWKNTPEKTFVSPHPNPSDRFIAQQLDRIGEEVDDWQPHVTEVIVLERYVTPWRTVATTE